MPVEKCRRNGRPGWRWGKSGACYTFKPGDEHGSNEAKRRAYVQGYAIEQNGGPPMDEGRSAEEPEIVKSEPQVWTKSFETKVERQATIGDNDMELVNQFALEPLTAEQVYITRQHLCNDQVDRAHERFTKAILDRFAETLPGKPVLTGHDHQMVPAGKYIDAKVVKDADGVHHLLARSYTLVSDALTDKIKAGIAGGVSIGFRAVKRTCDLCGKDYDQRGRGACDHVAGQDHDGKTCTVTYDGDPAGYEAREGSYVAFPCQFGAQTVRSGATYDHSVKAAQISVAPTDAKGPERMDELAKAQAENAKLLARVEELEENAPFIEAGKQFLTEVKAKITELSAKLGQTKQAALYLRSEPALAELLEYRDELFKQYDEAHPPKGDGLPAPPPAPVKQEVRPGIRAGRLFGGRAA